MLRPGKINRDLLTERVRKQLGYRYEGERELLMSDLDSLGSAS
jgi:hypothetical protein